MKTSRIVKDKPESDLEAQKQIIAYQLWEEEGRPEGKANEHWAKACLVVMSLDDGEEAPSQEWSKRQNQNEPHQVRDGLVAEQSTVDDHFNKRSTGRHAA